MNAAASAAPVTYDLSDAVATVTLNRPEAMNSLDLATKVLLLETLRQAAADDRARVVVLTGSGRAFCTGQDLKEHSQLLAAEGDQLASTVDAHYNPLVSEIATMAKPVLAAVNGVAAGAGASLSFACDLRIVADTAAFNTSFAGVALSCDTGASFYLPQLVGRSAAMDLLYFPRSVPADEALELGLASRVVPADALVDEVRGVAERLASGPTIAYGAIRRAVAFSARSALADALAFESRMMSLTGATEDHRNAVDSFVNKQRPVFEGR